MAHGNVLQVRLRLIISTAFNGIGGYPVFPDTLLEYFRRLESTLLSLKLSTWPDAPKTIYFKRRSGNSIVVARLSAIQS